jgi:hypothetical protein
MADRGMVALWRRVYRNVQQIAGAEITHVFGQAWRGGKFQGPYVTLATTSVVGVVKPDGATIDVAGDGTISAVGGGGSATFHFVPKTSDYAITTADSGIEVDASGGAVTITLPTAVGATQQYCVKRVDTVYANAVSIVPQAGQTIDSAAGQLLVAQSHALTFGSNNANWDIASSHYPNPGTTLGDLVVIDANGVPQRLAVGANTKVLTADTGKPLGEDWE